MTQKPRIYFAHPMSQYGMASERLMISYLEEVGFEVVNPNDEPHRGRISEIRIDIPNRDAASKAIMDYFISICGTCDCVAFVPFPDGSIGAGVVLETDSFIKRNAPAFHLIWDDKQKNMNLRRISDLGNFRKLSIDETRNMLAALATSSCAPKPSRQP